MYIFTDQPHYTNKLRRTKTTKIKLVINMFHRLLQYVPSTRTLSCCSCTCHSARTSCRSSSIVCRIEDILRNPCWCDVSDCSWCGWTRREHSGCIYIISGTRAPAETVERSWTCTSAASLLGSDKDFTHMMRWTRYENNKITDIRKQLYYICTCFSQTTLSHKVCTSTYDTVASLYFILQLDAHPTFGPWALSITVIRRHVKNLIIESPSSTFSKLQALQTQPVMTLLLVVLGEAPLANGTHGVLTGRHDVSDNRVRVRYLYARRRWNDDGKTPFVYL